MKKVLRVFSRVLSVFLTIALLLAAYVFFVTLRTPKDRVPSIFGFSVLHVVSGSMEPTIPTGSMVLVRKVDASAVQVGDIICFYSNDPQIEGMPNTHRVTEIRAKGGTLSFITQGDASETPDPYPVYADRLVGLFVCTTPLGKVMDLLHNQAFFFFVLIIPLCAVIFVEFLRVKTAAAKKEENDAQKD